MLEAPVVPKDPQIYPEILPRVKLSAAAPSCRSGALHIGRLSSLAPSATMWPCHTAHPKLPPAPRPRGGSAVLEGGSHLPFGLSGVLGAFPCGCREKHHFLPLIKRDHPAALRQQLRTENPSCPDTPGAVTRDRHRSPHHSHFPGLGSGSGTLPNPPSFSWKRRGNQGTSPCERRRHWHRPQPAGAPSSTEHPVTQPPGPSEWLTPRASRVSANWVLGAQKTPG